MLSVVPQPTTGQFTERFAIGLSLDHLWSETMGMSERDKETVLTSLVDVLDDVGTPYAVMGGVAIQLYTEEPRTTADVDIALHTRDDIPRGELERRGFSYDGLHRWSENWRGPAPLGTPRKQRISVQFSADDLMSASVDRAVPAQAGSLRLRLVTMEDLILLKLAAAAESSRRASKRLQDLADVTRLLEEHPGLDSQAIRGRLRTIRRSLPDK